jgi:hypothetical protein
VQKFRSAISSTALWARASHDQVAFELVLATLLSACAGGGDADLGPDPGGGFYDGGNINVGHVNPQWAHDLVAGDLTPIFR